MIQEIDKKCGYQDGDRYVFVLKCGHVLIIQGSDKLPEGDKVDCQRCEKKK